MRRYENRSIWRQLLTFLIVVICLLSLTSSVTAVWISYSQSRQALEQNSLRIAENLSRLSVLSLITSSKENAQEALSQVFGFNDVTGVVIFSEDQVPLLSQGSIYWNSEELSDWFVIDEATVVKNDSNAWIIAAPVFLDSSPLSETTGAAELNIEPVTENLLGFVVIKISKRSLKQLINNLISYNLIATLILSIFLIWLLYSVLQRLTRPIYSLSETMDLAQSSGEHTYAEIEGPKEVRTMAKSYNAMMQALEEQEDKLIALNSGLESEVEVRTRELVLARDAALVAARSKSEFLANISHELRTPLQAVTGYIELVIEELDFHPEFDAQVEDLDAALQSSQRLLYLINSILDLAKCEAGKMDLVTQQCSLNGLLKEIESTIRPLALKNKNHFSVTYPEQDHCLEVDKEKVQQILINLLSNACKFTESGTISLICLVDETGVIWKVTDTGTGIPHDQLEQIFHKFEQLDGSVKRKYSGTGLGLAISRLFAEMMGGSLTVSSEVNKGSTFTFWLDRSKTFENVQSG
ncbi:MAG: HAMP domain-containing sensor histidine kinase [Neptuniibacter sp.]